MLSTFGESIIAKGKREGEERKLPSQELTLNASLLTSIKLFSNASSGASGNAATNNETNPNWMTISLYSLKMELS